MYDMLDEVVGVRESRKETGVNEIDPGQVKKVIGPVSRTCLRFPIIDKSRLRAWEAPSLRLSFGWKHMVRPFRRKRWLKPEITLRRQPVVILTCGPILAKWHSEIPLAFRAIATTKCTTQKGKSNRSG